MEKTTSVSAPHIGKIVVVCRHVGKIVVARPPLAQERQMVSVKDSLCMNGWMLDNNDTLHSNQTC